MRRNLVSRSNRSLDELIATRLLEGIARLETCEILWGQHLPRRESRRRQGKPVSAATYLKAAGTFGFHGVYRVLARELGIEVGGLLGEAGSHLLEVWEQEQGLDGFRAGRTDEALRWRDAIPDGLAEGAVARKGGWVGGRTW